MSKFILAVLAALLVATAATSAALANPLAADRLFVDPQQPAAKYGFETIAREPHTERFGNFSFGNNGIPSITAAAQRYLRRVAAQGPGTVPQLATYRILSGHCHGWYDTADRIAAYHQFINDFSKGIGRTKTILFLELDSIITMGCLSPHGQQIRESELRYAIGSVHIHAPNTTIYLDAGAADALPFRKAARFLRASGVSKTAGFLLNSTHFDWTMKEMRYGWAISKLTHGKHFIINTGDNGRGPLIPQDRVHQGNEVLCNPPGRGLGPLPTTHTGYRNVDAFLWTTNPGESGGACVPGAPPEGVYWPQYASMLIRNADFRVR